MNSEPRQFIVDTFAWVEYFDATPRGEQAKKIIESEKNELFTSDVCLAEIKFWLLNDNKDVPPVLSVVLQNSTILHSNMDDWLSAAQIKFEKRKNTPNIGLVDCLTIHHSQKQNAKILTGDKHFKNEKNAALI